jgi:hypothetical protein
MYVCTYIHLGSQTRPYELGNADGLQRVNVLTLIGLALKGIICIRYYLAAPGSYYRRFQNNTLSIIMGLMDCNYTAGQVYEFWLARG